MLRSPEARWTLESFSMRCRITPGTVTRTCSDGCCAVVVGSRLPTEGYIEEEEEEEAWEDGELASGLVE